MKEHPSLEKKTHPDTFICPSVTRVTSDFNQNQQLANPNPKEPQTSDLSQLDSRFALGN